MFWLLAGCTGNDDRRSKNLGEDQPGGGSREDGAPEIHADLFPGLTAFYQKQVPSFDPYAFEMTGELRDQQYITTAYNENQVAAFKPLLTYNADSSRAIDMYSGSFVAVTKNGQTKFESGEPDTEVALIDFKNKTRKRIFYTGPSFLVLDVRWLNDSVILLAGALAYGADQVQPQIHKIFLMEGVHEIYEIHDPVSVNFSEYHEQRIKAALNRGSRQL